MSSEDEEIINVLPLVTRYSRITVPSYESQYVEVSNWPCSGSENYSTITGETNLFVVFPVVDLSENNNTTRALKSVNQLSKVNKNSKT